MNALLQEKETRLQALTSCPVCKSRRLEYWRHETFGPQVDEEDDFLWRLPKVDDQATARFWCGMILWLDEKAKINIRYGCPLATLAAVLELNRKPETVFEEKAA